MSFVWEAFGGLGCVEWTVAMTTITQVLWILPRHDPKMASWIWEWQNYTSRSQKLELHLLVKVHSASAPWLNHCRPQFNIGMAAEIDIAIFEEWQAQPALQETTKSQKNRAKSAGRVKHRRREETAATGGWQLWSRWSSHTPNEFNPARHARIHSLCTQSQSFSQSYGSLPEY